MACREIVPSCGSNYLKPFKMKAQKVAGIALGIFLLILALFLIFNPTERNQASSSDIELVREYISKSEKSITDKNGFPLNYDYSYTLNLLNDLGKSVTVSNEGLYRNSLYLQLFTGEVIVSLTLNGEHIKDVKFAAQVYDHYELNPLGINPIPKNFTKTREIYLPELDDISVRKQIITKITEPQFRQSYFEKNSHDKEMSAKWINESTTFIKNSGILDYHSLQND
jgi:hypothetical protein